MRVKRVGEFYGTSTANCRRPTRFFLKAGFVQIVSSGKFGIPPCKSGQLKKDLGLEASSLRHAARLVIFEIMRSFFLWFKRGRRLSWSPDTGEANAQNFPHARRQCYATLTSMAFDFGLAVVGRCTLSTPSRKSAVTFVLSASSGSVKLRRKLPKERSMRWNFRF
jgi:hypothetical protein